MASRSFKPASYLASAAQQTPSRRSPRPSFARTSSSSSTVSCKSDDSFIASLRGLNTGESHTASQESDKHKSAGASSPLIFALGSPVSHPQKVNDTPSRKKSKPIAIELPPRNHPTTYTPLTGRGEQRGGYFPDYEDMSKTYKEHHFGGRTPDSPSNMSASSSAVSSPTSDIHPRNTSAVLSSLPSSTAPIVVDALGIPAGKYYPSNYTSPANTRAATPTPGAVPTSSFTNLKIPSNIKTKRQKSGHERDSSDVKRKLQQYQRDMIVQARLATTLARGPQGMRLQMPEPVSPKLMPAGSPGPITPFELEDCDGYIAAGAKEKADGIKKKQQLIDDLINMEKTRAVHVEDRSMLN